MNDRTQFLADLGLFEMPPVECKPWCRDADGHPHNTCREDQVCGTVEIVIPLHHIQYDSTKGKDPAYNHLVTYVNQAPAEDPWIHVGIGESAGLSLTLDESVSLAMALLEQAERVRRHLGMDASPTGSPGRS